MPDPAEALGLLSLILHCEARQSARRAADGAFVPLHAQDPALWSRELVMEAEAALSRAATAAGLSADPAIRDFLLGGGYRFLRVGG